MPGSISDSYDPEFGTAAFAADVADAVKQVRATLTAHLGEKPPNNVQIVEDARGKPGPSHRLTLSQRDLRILRFCIERTLESL